jgi:prepilin peptidase CpaA
MWLVPGGPSVARCVLLGVSAVAAVTDARTGRIPNALTLPALACGLAAAFAERGSFGLAASLAGALLCAVVPLLLFSRGAMGGGDAKLLAAAGALLGPSAGLELQWAAYVAAAIYVVLAAVARRRLGATAAAVARLCARAVRGRAAAPGEVAAAETIRLGAFIFAAALLQVGPLPWGEP